MGIFASLFRRSTAPVEGWPIPSITDQRQTSDDRPNSSTFFWPGKTQAGVNVNHDTALTYAAVWACVKVITEDIGQMSWHVYRQNPDGGKLYLPSHPVNYLLLQQANPEMSAMTFRETLLAWALLWGNGYAEIERDTAGRAIWMWPVAPDRVNPDRTEDGTLYYDISNRGQSNSVIPAFNMLHLKGLGCDGVMGYSVVTHARQSIGLGLAMEQFGSSFFGNGAHPSGALSHPGALTDKARTHLTESIKTNQTRKNALSFMVLEEGMKWESFGVPPNDAQFLESRVHQLDEICRWFRVTPQKIANLMRATFNNVEHLDIAHVKDTLVPWVTRLEQEADMKMFGGNRQNLFTKINVNSLLRGDIQSRFAAYSTGRNGGWLTPNDVLRLEDQNPIPSEYGDSYMVPKNSWVISKEGKVLFEPEKPDVPEEPVGLQTTQQQTPMRNGALH